MRTVEERFWAKVDKTDGCWLWTASIHTTGYGQFRIQGRTVVAHREAYRMLVGPIPEGLDLDHKCRNRACVNPAHLRPATHKQNLENQRGAHANSKSGIRGVHWNKRARKWRAVLMHFGEVHYNGMFTDIKEAEAAVLAKRLELFTHNDVDRGLAA